MNFVEPLAELYEEKDLVKKIERCYRMCYKSEDKIKEGSAQFMNVLIHNDYKNKHWSPLEHARVVVQVTDKIAFVVHDWQVKRHSAFIDVHAAILSDTSAVYYLTGNFRAFMDFIYDNKDSDVESSYAALQINNSLAEEYPIIFNQFSSGEHNPAVSVISEASDYKTFRVVTTRDILQELARHRSLSFSVESTRYCNYSKRGMTFTIPRPYAWTDEFDWEIANTYHYNQIDYPNESVERFIVHCGCCEKAYNKAIADGWKPQEARMLLPGALKSELYLTGTFPAWRHFLDLREDGDRPHPQIRFLAKLIHELLDKSSPNWKNSID